MKYAIKNIVSGGTEWEHVLWFMKKDRFGEVWSCSVIEEHCFATAGAAKAALAKRLAMYPENEGVFELWAITGDRYGMSNFALQRLEV